MQKVSQELAAELKSLYQEKKFSELIYKINANFGKNAPAGILNLLGAAKLLVAISDEEILSARQTFKDAFLKDKSLSEALYNYINLSTDVDDMDEALLLGEEYEKNFGYEKKVFHSLARLHRNLGNLRKSGENSGKFKVSFRQISENSTTPRFPTSRRGSMIRDYSKFRAGL